jgi:hypothetical protein
MLLGAAFKVAGTQPLTSIPLKGDYARRDMPRTGALLRHPVRDAGDVSDRDASAARASCCGSAASMPGGCAPLVQALYRAYFVAGRDISDPDVAADVAAEAGVRSRARARRNRRCRDQGSASPRRRSGDRGRRLRIAVRVRRRRAVLGSRSLRADRALARERRILTVSEFALHCFAQSGNAYKPALMLELAGADWTPRFVDYFGGETRTPAYRAINVMGEVPVLEHGARRLSQSGVILDYLARTLGSSVPATTSERREILRWLLFDNHKLTSYTATYRFMRTFARMRSRGGRRIPQARGDRMGRLDATSTAAGTSPRTG